MSILKQMKDSMSADLSVDDKAEEAREDDHARLVSAKKEEIATLTVVSGTKVKRKGELAVKVENMKRSH